LAQVEFVKRLAVRKEAVAARVTLAWLLAQKRWIVPIPGTTKLNRLEENLGSVEVELTAGDLSEIESSFAKIPVQGARLPEQVLQYSNR
jgi:aryl-alcohol dehydrogenase-like predicted oxidoreductase